MSIERIPIRSREQWLSLRLHDCTASDVGAICGEPLFGSAAEVWAIKKGLIPPTAETARMRAGRWFEPAVFEALAEVKPDWELQRAKVYFRDPAARLGCTPDAGAIDPGREGIGIVEAKNILPHVFTEFWCYGDDDDPDAPAEPPLAYQLQILTQAMLAGASWAVIAVLINNPYDPKLRLFPVERHAAAEQMIRDRVAAFWRDYLDPNICPPIDPTRDADLVKALFPKDDGTEIDLTDDNHIPELVAERATKKEALKVLKEQLSAVETEIKAKLGPHSYGRLGDGRVISHKQQHRSGYTVAPTSFRVLRISNA